MNRLRITVILQEKIIIKAFKYILLYIYDKEFFVKARYAT